MPDVNEQSTSDGAYKSVRPATNEKITKTLAPEKKKDEPTPQSSLRKVKQPKPKKNVIG